MEGSKKAVYAALFGNLAIAIFKFIAAFMGNSSAMLAEAYHSLSDTGNQILLLLGLKRSEKKPDKLHPYGYGKAQFFYAFIVAMLLFGVAGVLSVREGIHKFSNPEPLQHLTLIFVALGVSIIFEILSLRVAYKEFKEAMEEEKFDNIFQAIKESKDPTLLTVVFEDSLALLSLIVATIAIALTYFLDNPLFDALGSVIIGIFLMVFSIALAYEVKKLLIGEGVSERKREELLRAILEVKQVKQVVDLRTMHLGPEEVLVTVEVNLEKKLHTKEIEKVIDKIDAQVHKILPKAKCYVEVESAAVKCHTFGGVTRCHLEKAQNQKKH